MASDPAARSERPLSPHLLIYRPQITSILSIVHRATGVALTLGALLLAWWLVAAASGESAFTAVQWFLSSWLGLLVLLGFSAALFYHLLNGIRHLFWDAGYGYDLKIVTASGMAVLGGTVVLTVLAWAVGLIVLGARP